jgi:5-methylthioadenosine/S-adenosylhomocysteine deaminase
VDTKPREVDILIKNGFIVTMDPERRILDNGGIAIQDGKILCIADSVLVESSYHAKKVIDARDRVIFPGMINTHNHLFQVLLKDLGKDRGIFDWLNSSIRRAYRHITEDDIYLAAVMGCVEQLKSGVTTVLDFQYAHGQPNLSDKVVDAFLTTGIRGILGRGHANTARYPADLRCAHDESEEEFFDDFVRLSRKYARYPTIGFALAPGNVWCLSRKGFITCAELAKSMDSFITMHSIETAEDGKYALAEHGMAFFDFLRETGVLSSRFLAVHCAEITQAEIAVLARHDVKVSYNAISNMMMGYRTLPVSDLLDAGITVSVATDGAASNDNQDMLQVLKFSALYQKSSFKDPTVMPAAKILEMATIDGAEAIFKGREIGSLEAGKQADLFIFNPVQCNTTPMTDPVVSLVYSAGKNNIETTIVNGKIVMEEGRMVTIDEHEIIMRLQAAASKLRNLSVLGSHQWNQPVDFGSFRN